MKWLILLWRLACSFEIVVTPFRWLRGRQLVCVEVAVITTTIHVGCVELVWDNPIVLAEEMGRDRDPGCWPVVPE